MFYPKIDKRRILPSTTVWEKNRRKRLREAEKRKLYHERCRKAAVEERRVMEERWRRTELQNIAGQIFALATVVPTPKDLRRLAEYVIEEFGTHDGGAIATELKWAANTIERYRRWRQMEKEGR